VKAFWTDKRPNGAAIDAGTFCRVIDLEDGTHPIYTYGRTEAEVFEKIERQSGNAQLALARRAANPPTTSASGPAPAPAADNRFRLSADQVMQATEDLKNPATAGRAVVLLQAHETGIDPQKARLDGFIRLGLEWEREHPEFFAHYANRKVLGDYLGALVNGEVERITKEMITTAYCELLAKGLLYEPQETNSTATTTTSTPGTFPGESPVQQTERPRKMFSTGVSANRLRAPQSISSQPKPLKYTEKQIRTMPLEDAEALLRAKDPDYALAVRTYFPQQNQQRSA